MLLVGACGGCVLGPDYSRPVLEEPGAFRNADLLSSDGPTLAAGTGWWRSFGDPSLDALVDESLAANHDLAVATARVEEFAARLGTSQAQGQPQLGYSAGAGRVDRGPGDASGSFSPLLSASWELDLWGRLRRGDEAARANLMATEQARLGVALTLVSAVVGSYVTLLDLDQRLEIAEETVAGRRQSVGVFQQRFEGGVVSEFEIAKVTAEYEAAVGSIPELQQAIALQEHALGALLGRNPGAIERGGTLQDLQRPPVPSGLPSSLVARRPDILQAEQQLVAANARVGVARTLYFPSLALTGTGGSASSELDQLFSGPARTWSFIGQLAGPIVAGGAIEASNRQADAQRDQALAQYRRTVQAAFRDVDDVLASIRSNGELVASLERRVAALRRAVLLARERYDHGYADYLDVLDTERGLFSGELALTAARGEGYRNLIDLYRALGGDWIGAAAPLPSAPAAYDARTSAAPGDLPENALPRP